VLDNTYPTRAQRADVLAAARRHGAAVRCVWLDTSLEDAQVNAAARAYARLGRQPEPAELIRGRDPVLLPPAALFRWRRELEPPGDDEGFVAIERRGFTRAATPGGAPALIVELADVVWRGRPEHADDVALIDGAAEAIARWRAAGWAWSRPAGRRRWPRAGSCRSRSTRWPRARPSCSARRCRSRGVATAPARRCAGAASRCRRSASSWRTATASISRAPSTSVPAPPTAASPSGSGCATSTPRPGGAIRRHRRRDRSRASECGAQALGGGDQLVERAAQRGGLAGAHRRSGLAVGAGRAQEQRRQPALQVLQLDQRAGAIGRGRRRGPASQRVVGAVGQKNSPTRGS
jgi:hypothetical protein